MSGTTSAARIELDSLIARLSDRLDNHRSDLPKFCSDARKLLQEVLSDGDWARISAIVALLWFKFDRLIELGREHSEILKNIHRELIKK